MPNTLRSALSTHDNALNFVRLVLAASVILSHSWAVGGFGQHPFNGLGDWAVNGFFALSGYLIAGSRLRLNFGQFMMSRAFRIFPAFWLVLVGTAFVIAPLSTLATDETWQLGSALDYVVRNAGLYVFQWGVDDTLTSVPFVGAWNGSLWTLFYEFVAYIGAALLLTLPWARRHALVATGVATAAVIVAQIAALGPLDVSTNLFLNFLRLGSFFAAGMFRYFLADKLSLKWWNAAIAGATLAVMAVLGVADLLGQIPLAYLLLWIGARAKTRIGSKNDVSYGVYVWGFPVQQLLVVFGFTWLGPWLTALLALIVTLPLAWGSWKLVENPAMRLRKRITSRSDGRLRARADSAVTSES